MLNVLLDLLALASALIAAWLWYRASNNSVRRVSKHEELNALDLNRIITAINRTQAMNRRAAIATAISALVIAAKFARDLIAAMG
ncbi:hypothetical protein [Rhabdaerophilum sp. SD176]|uniref:hypothetical protein n=1 Tax=Rhabdaerophilum sp. SD176 TaxID=2983548 RepID=UPI0024DF5123|nr:hypothetical protein [Rhabdaerophilum sp. SD176]